MVIIRVKGFSVGVLLGYAGLFVGICPVLFQISLIFHQLKNLLPHLLPDKVTCH